MTKQNTSSLSMGASECARRTGLTIRALRVYERLGLIQPPRAANGWRLYGQKELVRLNAVAALKGLGLSLLQIRDSLSGPALVLREVLQLQVDVWQKRRVRAEEGLELVTTALRNLDGRERLPIEELCNLARSMDMNDIKQITREVINESITPEEERAWATWWANRPRHETQEMQDYATEQRTLLGALVKLQSASVDVNSPEVQLLAERWSANLSRYHVRERMLKALTWNASLTRKWLNVGERITARTVAPPESHSHGSDLWQYLRAALKASPLGRAIDALIADAKSLLAKQVPADAPAAKALAVRLDEICQQYWLGESTTYVRWSCSLGTISESGQTAELDPIERAAWEFLIDAHKQAPTHVADLA
jgi:MerR family transcriptional regulator, thiopeptide resistance regulator